LFKKPIWGDSDLHNFLTKVYLLREKGGMTELIPEEICADLIILNGNIITIDSKRPRAEAVAINNGKIIKVGTNEEIKVTSSSKTIVWDAKHKTVIPGFIDAHQHLSLYAEKYLQEVLGPDRIRSIDDIKKIIAQKTAVTPKGHWIRCQGYDDTKTIDNRFLNRLDLDAVTPEHPVFVLHVGCHAGVVNSEALRRAEIKEDSPDPEGGRYGRFENSGRLNGTLYEKAVFMFASESLTGKTPIIPPFSREKRRKAIQKACVDFLRAGITSVHDALVSPQYIMSYQDAYIMGELGIRVYMLIAHYFLENLESLGIYTGFGNEKLKVGAIKIILDGAISSRTAYVSEPFIGTKNDCGMLLISSREEFNDIVLRAHKAGFQLAVHANGDRAIDMAIEAYQRALEQYPRADHRHRIEHCTVMNPTLFKKMKRLGLIAVPFGVFLWYHGEKVVPFYGEERARMMFAHRSFLDKGIEIAGSSDCPAMPFEPLLAIQACVTRETSFGTVVGPEQRISPEEALRVYTLVGAYFSFEEHIKGSIEPGKLADMVVLSDDPTTIDPKSIKDIKVIKAMVGGEILFTC